MNESIKKLIRIAPDDKFREILQYLMRTQNVENPESYMYMVLNMLSMPQYANAYRFLIELDKHELQKTYEEKNFHEA